MPPNSLKLFFNGTDSKDKLAALRFSEKIREYIPANPIVQQLNSGYFKKSVVKCRFLLT
jgi:hypothetical protein